MRWLGPILLSLVQIRNSLIAVSFNLRLLVFLGEQFQNCLLVSFVGETRVLQLVDEEMEETEIKGACLKNIFGTEKLVFCCNMYFYCLFSKSQFTLRNNDYNFALANLCKCL